MRHHIVLRLVSRLTIPVTMLFALYVQFHGDFGPGGGFQAGVIFASAIILYTLLHNLEAAQKVISLEAAKICAAAGLLLYILVGIAGMLAGGNYLDYNVLAHEPKDGQHIGILLIELGVGITVASIMIVVFYSFVGYQPDTEQIYEKRETQN